MLVPKKVKHRKWHKGRTKGIETRGTELAFGSFGLKAMEARWINSRQIEAARRAIIRFLKKKGKFWIKIFPYKPITQKGNETPMGGGKGGVEYYCFPIKPGRIMFELDGIEEDVAKESLKRAGEKLGIRTKFVTRH